MNIETNPRMMFAVNNNKIPDNIASLVEKVNITMSENAITMIDIRSKSIDFFLNVNKYFPVGSELDVWMGWGNDLVYQASGIIMRHKPYMAGSESAEIELKCFDKLYQMSRTKKIRKWTEASYTEIIDDIVSDYNFGMKEISIFPYKKKNVVKKKEDTDYSYIEQLSNLTGRMFWCDKNIETQTWNFYFTDESPEQPMDYTLIRKNGDFISVEPEYLIMEEQILDLKVYRYSGNNSWHLVSELQDDLVFSSPGRISPATTNFHSYIRIGVGDLAFNIATNTRFMEEQDITNFARSWIRERRKNLIKLNSARTVGLPYMRPMQTHKLDLTVLTNRDYTGSYYISEVEHEMSNSGFFTTFKGRKVIDEIVTGADVESYKESLASQEGL